MSKKINELPRDSAKLEECYGKFLSENAFQYPSDFEKKKRIKEANELEHATDTKGDEETYRTSIRRERDKILYTGGFRRLQDKTQVMSATVSGDHRTRLTHTLEVEQIASSISDALCLNKDLVSAIALGHDIGHTPFGHAAERALNKCLKDLGGFHHPIQSVNYIWDKYHLKISDEIYEGIIKHDSDMYTIDIECAKKQLNYGIDLDNDKYKLISSSKYENIYFSQSKKNEILSEYFGKFPTTKEAEVVIWADKIAYITHDLEDFLGSKIYTNAEKANDIDVENNKDKQTLENNLLCILNKLRDEDQKDYESIKLFETRDLIRNITSNLITTSVENMNKQGEKVTADYGKCKNRDMYLDNLTINLNDSFRSAYKDLRKFLDTYYIFSPEVQRSDAKATFIVNGLFNKFMENDKLLPLEIQNRLPFYSDTELSKVDETSLKKLEKLLLDNLSEIDYVDFNKASANGHFCDMISTLSNEIAFSVADYDAIIIGQIAKNVKSHLQNKQKIKKYSCEDKNITFMMSFFKENGTANEKDIEIYKKMVENGELEDGNDNIELTSYDIDLIVDSIHSEIQAFKDPIKARVIASYIASMTDTFAENTYRNLSASKDNYSL